MGKYNVDNLTPFKTKWVNTPTKLIRVPEKLANDILLYAHKIDESITIAEYNNYLIQELEMLIEKINRKEKGYRSNGSGALFKDLKSYIVDFKNSLN